MCFLFASFKHTGKGFGIERIDEKFVLVSNWNNNTTSIVIKDNSNEVATSIKEEAVLNVQIPRINSEYDNLSSNEKLVYLAIIEMDKEILINKQQKTKLTITFKDFIMNNYSSSLSYLDKKEKVLNAWQEIDFTKIYHALHTDFDYLSWWEENMSWTITEPVYLFDDNDYSDSYFTIKFTPASAYMKSENMISLDAVNTANEAYLYALEIANQTEGMSDVEKIKYFKNWLLMNVSYDENVAEKINNGQKNNLRTSQNYVYLFDKNDFTNTVCTGYTTAFQMLCDLAEIETVYKESGEMIVDDEETKHAWNIVNLNDRKYLVDITNIRAQTIGFPDDLFMIEVYNTDNFTINISKWTSATYFSDKE